MHMSVEKLGAHIRRYPFLKEWIWFLRRMYWRMQRLIFANRPVIDIGPLLRDAISNAKPLCVGKMGSVELRGLRTYLARDVAGKKEKRPPDYKPYIRQTLFVNAGVFPDEPDMFDKFGAIYLNAVMQSDALATWDVAGEAYVLCHYAPAARLFYMNMLESFLSPTPWTAVLEGKRVLVISPFAATIQEQYGKRTELWDAPDVLPAFELLTIRAPLSAGIKRAESPDWITSLDALKAQMDELDYDVVLVGAGAYSLPLAAHAKSRGKVGIHLGGALQLFFGIVGGRWEKNPTYAGFINSSWTRPRGDETPESVEKVENACYW